MSRSVYIIGAYKLEDCYKCFAKELEYNDFTVGFFPLYELYEHSYHSSDILRCLQNKSPRNSYINLKTVLNADIVIWWHLALRIPTEELSLIISMTPNIKHYIYNFDPILINSGKEYWQNIERLTEQQYPLFDTTLTCNPTHVKLLREQNIDAYYAYPGYDPEYHYYERNDAYSCDVSIVCSTLYDDGIFNESILIQRRELVDRLYKMSEKSELIFHIYGPERFKSLYPNSYKGFIPYTDCRYVFSNSKINLNISPVGNSLNCDIDGRCREYFAERMPQILACRGLMLCDIEFKTIIDSESYVQAEQDIEKCILQIKDILESHNQVKYDKVRQNGEKRGKAITFTNVIKHIMAY